MRTVGVKLVADAAEYEAGINAAQKSTNALGDEIVRAAEEADKLTAATVIAGKEQQTFGRSALTAAGHLEKLDREISSTERELQLLAVSFAEAQTAADRVDLSKAMRKSQSDLRNLNKSKSLIKDLLPSDADAKKAGQSFTKNFSEGFSGLGAQLMPALVIAAVASAPAIGAVISGAVIGAAGVGGIVGGLLLAARDPQVKTAWGGFATSLEARLTDAAKPFVPVALDGIHEIDKALQGINFEGLFSDAAKQAGPLINGVARAVEGLGHGITDLIHNAGPAVAAIGQGIGDFGQTLGAGLSELSHDGPAATDALHNMFTMIDAGTTSVFHLIDGLTKAYGWLRKFADPGHFAIIDSLNSLGGGSASDTWHKVASGITGVGTAARAAAGPIANFTDALDAAASAGQALYGSETNVAQAFVDAAKAAKANGKTLDLNTQKGRDNRTALQNVASALTANYDAFVKVNQEGVASNQIAGENRARFIALAESFGKSKAQAAALATQMGLIPAKKVTDFTANTHGAANNIASLQAQIDRLHGKQIDVVVSASISQKSQNTLDRLGGARAEGGPVRAGVAYVVGEHRPEVFVPDVSGKIVPSLGQYAAMSSSSAWSAPAPRLAPVGGRQTIVVEGNQTLTVAPGSIDTFGRMMLTVLRVQPGVRTTMAKTLGVKAT